jgi:hypothetical protein
MEKKVTQRHSFVLRIWREEGVPGWRGWLQNVRSGETESVRDIEGLLAFVERWTAKLDDEGAEGLR